MQMHGRAPRSEHQQLASWHEPSLDPLRPAQFSLYTPVASRPQHTGPVGDVKLLFQSIGGNLKLPQEKKVQEVLGKQPRDPTVRVERASDVWSVNARHSNQAPEPGRHWHYHYDDWNPLTWQDPCQTHRRAGPHNSRTNAPGPVHHALSPGHVYNDWKAPFRGTGCCWEREPLGGDETGAVGAVIREFPLPYRDDAAPHGTVVYR